MSLRHGVAGQMVFRHSPVTCSFCSALISPGQRCECRIHSTTGVPVPAKLGLVPIAKLRSRASSFELVKLNSNRSAFDSLCCCLSLAGFSDPFGSGLHLAVVTKNHSKVVSFLRVRPFRSQGVLGLAVCVVWTAEGFRRQGLAGQAIRSIQDSLNASILVFADPTPDGSKLCASLVRSDGSPSLQFISERSLDG